MSGGDDDNVSTDNCSIRSLLASLKASPVRDYVFIFLLCCIVWMHGCMPVVAPFGVVFVGLVVVGLTVVVAVVTPEVTKGGAREVVRNIST